MAVRIREDLFGCGFVIALAAGLATPVHAQDLSRLKGTGEVVITSGGGTWEAAQRKAFFEPFTRDTGIKVVLIPEDRSKLLASAVAGHAEADITSLGAGLVKGFDSKGALAAIDYDLFDKDTLNNIPAQFKQEKAVASFIYSIGVAYNTEQYPDSGPKPETWADYYDLKKFPGPRGSANCDKFVDAGVLEAALLGDGVPADKLYPLDLDRAFKKLEGLKPHVKLWYDSGNATPDALLRKQVVISTAWLHRITVARKKAAPLQGSWKQSLIQYDVWAVMKNGPNTANAMKFIAYVSQAKPQSVLAEELNTGPINNKAYELISAETQATMPGSPANKPVQVLQDYAYWNATGADGATNWENALKRCVRMLSQ